MGYEARQLEYEDVTVRTLDVHRGMQIAAEAHPHFFTIYWTPSVSLGGWLEALSQLFQFFGIVFALYGFSFYFQLPYAPFQLI